MKVKKQKKACFILSIFALFLCIFTWFDIEKIVERVQKLESAEKIGFLIGYFFLQCLFIGLGFYSFKKTKKEQETSYTKMTFYLLLVSFCMTILQFIFLILK